MDALLGALGLAFMLALALLSLVLPPTGPVLEELCRGVQRARFWTRLLAIAMVLAVPLGVLLAHVQGDRFLWVRVPFEEPGPVHDLAVMWRMGLQAGALVFSLLVVGVLSTVTQPTPSAAPKASPRK